MITDVTHLFRIPLEWPREALQLGRVDGIAVHHEAVLWPRPNATVEEEMNHLRAIDRYHREVKGFLGFAYQMAAFPTGRIYQVTSLKQMAAAVYQKNDSKYSIMLAGLFSTTVPGEKHLDATAEGINHFDNFLGRKVEVGPHRKWTSTDCPGDTWEQWVPGLRARVKEEDMLEMIHSPNGVGVIVGGYRMALTSQAHHDALHAAGYTDRHITDAEMNAIPQISWPSSGGNGLTSEETIAAVQQALREGTH